ncbi:hypothetical protein [Vulcanococcus sp.]|uniref:hypothetical protein n=1 Tax=Vulcanococcus sp. TaxID=2856995 RepID=UPI003C04F57A
MSMRKQLSMVLEPELIDAIKGRAKELSLTTTAYITQLVRRDLGLPVSTDGGLEQRVKLLEERLESLKGDQSAN